MSDGNKVVIPTSHFFHEKCMSWIILRKQGVIYSQALRYRRITTQDGEFLNKLDRLRTTLLTRGYKDRDITKQFNRVMNRTQADILRTHTTKSNTTPKNLPFVIEYHTDLPHISNILITHWPKIQTDRRLNTLCQKSPFHSIPERQKPKRQTS